MIRLLTTSIVLLSISIASAAEPAKKPNVLFIAVDDLNHWVGHLGRNPQTKTPNIDRLAKMGVTFTHAYCAAPVCNPSRAALMTGRLPIRSGMCHDTRRVLFPNSSGGIPADEVTLPELL